MATVTLSRHECANDLLPRICAVCGQPASRTHPIIYTWSPWRSWLLVFVWVVRMRWMKVPLPLCETHLARRRRRSRRFDLTLLAIFGLWGAIAACAALEFSWADEDVLAGIGIANAALFLIWLAVAVWTESHEIQPARITSRSITLMRVHEVFVAAVADHRSRGDDPFAEHRFGDLRDDFDEEARSPRSPSRN